MKTLQLLLPALLLIAVGCDNDTPKEEALEQNARRFEDITIEDEVKVLTKYAANSLLSIRLADVALQRTQNEDVKALATKIAKDHRSLYKGLEEIAANYGITLPVKLSEQQKETLAELKNKEGNAFNKMYLSTVIDYHKAFDGKMEDIISGTDYDGLINLARAIDSHAYVHLNRAKELHSKYS